MNGKRAITVLLLVFVVASIAWLAVQNTGQPAPAASPTVANAAPEVANATGESRYIAYYFRNNVRCPSCLKIEQYTDEAIQTGFGEQLAAGTLQWKVVNTDQPGNEHFVKDYQLQTKSVVLVEMRGGKEVKYKNLEKVWELLGSQPGFVAYIQEEAAAFMQPS